MASANFINECKNDAYMNRYGKILISEPTTPTASPNLAITDAREDKALDFKLSKLSTQEGTPTPDNPQEVKTIKGYRNLIGLDTEQYQVDLKAGDKITLKNEGTQNVKIQLFTNYGDTTRNDYWNINAGVTRTITVAYNSKAISWDNQPDTNAWCVLGEDLLPYVPYGTNWIYVKIIGNDLFNKNTITRGKYLNYTDEPVDSGGWNYTDYMPIKPNTTYVTSGMNSGTGNNPARCYYDENKNFISGVKHNQSINHSFIDTSPSNAYYMRESSLTADIDTIQIFEEKYITLPLNNNEIVGIGDYKDEYIIDKTGHCYLNKKMGKVILNENQGWTINNTGTENYSYRNGVRGQAITTGGLLCTHYPYINSIIATNTAQGIAIYNASATTLQFRIRWGTEQSLDDFKTFLSNNNPEVYYVLATPQLIDLNYDVDLSLYEGTNNITNSENADMSLTYKSVVELNQSNKIQEFSIDSGCYVDGNIAGSVYSKKLNTQLIDALDYDIEDMDCDASVGVTYENNNNEVTEYMNLGKYIVEKPKDEQTENFSSFVAYDLLMQRLEEKYETELDYENETITIADVYSELCSKLGLTPTTTTFTNSTITVEGNPFTNAETNRLVLSEICKVACAFVDIDYDTNEIDLKWLSSSLDYTFQMSDYCTVDGGKTVYGPINSLIIKSSQIDSENVSHSDEESILANGEHQFIISEDYFLYNATKRDEALLGIWNKVNGLTYVECTLKTLLGKPFLKIGNKIRIYTGENEYFDSYVLQNIFKYDGAFSNTIKCPVLTEQQIQTKQDVSLGEKLRQTQIIVNKHDGIIEEYTSKTDDLIDADIEINGKFANYVPNATYNLFVTEVKDTQTNTYKKTEVNQILKGTYRDENDNLIATEAVITTSGTFDKDGMTYEKTNANTKTTINEVGVGVKKTDGSDDYILFAGYVDNNNSQYSDYQGQTLVATENIMVEKYLVVGSHSRFEDYEGGTGCFYIG